MKEYFKNMDIIEIDNVRMVDLIHSENPVQGIESDYYYDYYLEYEDTPERLADKLYGDPLLYWLILELNGCKHPIDDWYKNDEELMEYIEDKYGENGYNMPHHYETKEGGIDYYNSEDKITVTNYQYEEMKNEEKRVIRVYTPNFAKRFKSRG
jgi:hypothetical protein